MLKKEIILGVGITTTPLKEILEFLFDRIKQPTTKTILVTPNPEILVYAQAHKAYQDNLNEATLSLPDGVGIIIASKLLGKNITNRITGVDFIEEVCKTSKEKPINIGFLGGRPGIAERTVDCLRLKYPWIRIVFIAEEWSDTGFIQAKKYQEGKEISGKQDIDMLFVAFGFPKQENWIFDNINKLPVKAAMGVGGSFDYISGSVPRAPKVLRLLGLEWFYRLLKQPWRWRRQLSLFTFLRLVLKERETHKSVN